MDLTPYLTFNGDCEEALEFYADLFEGEIGALTRYADGPLADDVGPELLNKVMHAFVLFGDSKLMASDQAMGPYVRPENVYVHTAWQDDAEARRVFDALSRGGEVVFPYAATFWAPGFGMTRDRFGILWMVNCMKVDA